MIILDQDFVHLHNHGEHSNLRFRDSVNKVKDMILHVDSLGNRAMALTEHESISSHIKFLNTIKELKSKDKIHKDFKPILGNEIYLVDEEIMYEEMKDQNKKPKFYHFLILAKDNKGHEQMRELSTKAWTRLFNYKGVERVPTFYSDMESIVSENKGHLIASSACFIKGTQVKTIKGYKNIEDIDIGEKVLTLDNTFQNVNTPTKRKYKGNRVDLTFEKAITNHLLSTSDHKYAILHNNNIEWKSAENLEVGDVCLSPVENNYTYLKVLDVSEYNNNYLKKMKPHARIRNQIPNHIVLTDDFFRMFGLFLADGCLRFNKQNKCVNFTFNEQEFNTYFPFVENGMSQFNIKPYIKEIKKQHKVEVIYTSALLANVFYKIFDNNVVKGSDKRVPIMFKNISPEASINILYGYLLGDGYFRTREDHSGEIVSASISKTLSMDIIDLYRQFELSPCFRISAKHKGIDETPHKESYYVNLNSYHIVKELNKQTLLTTNELIDLFNTNKNKYKKEFIYLNGIKYINKVIKTKQMQSVDTEVYCLNVNNNHNFVCEDVIVHNCLGGMLPHLILSLLQEENEEIQERIKDELDDFLNWCLDLFGEDFYIELQPSLQQEQIDFNKMAIRIAKAYNIKWIVTTDAHYLTAKDREIHKAFLTSEDDLNNNREVDMFYSTTHFFTVDEIFKNMDYLETEDIEKAILNTKEIADKVIGYDFFAESIIPLRELPEKSEWYPVNQKILSKYPYIKELYEDIEGQHTFLITQTFKGIEERGIKKEKLEDVLERVNIECKEITGASKAKHQPMGAYLVTMQKNVDIIWEEAESFVGPGRGSANGYIINYLLGITQVNPLEQGVEMPHWRFMSAERPDRN